MQQLLRSSVVTAVLMLGVTSASHAGVVTYDFDTGSPSGSSTSFTYTLSGLTATFTGTSSGDYMIIDSSGLFGTLLSGNILSSSGTPDALTISFSSLLSGILVDFADADSTSSVTLTAMLSGSQVGTPSTTKGAEPPGQNFPENSLGFSGFTFDSVVISTTSSTLALDNIAVTTAASAAPEPGSFLLGGTALMLLLSLGSRLRRRA